MAVIAEIGRLIGSTLDIDEVYERFAAEARKLIPFDRLAVNLNSLHEENRQVAYCFRGRISGRSKGDCIPLQGSVSEDLMARQGRLFPSGTCVEEMYRDVSRSRCPSLSGGIRSMMSVPLIYRDEVIGGLHFRSKKSNAYTERHLRLAERIGAQIAGAIGNAQLFSILKRRRIHCGRARRGSELWWNRRRWVWPRSI